MCSPHQPPRVTFDTLPTPRQASALSLEDSDNEENHCNHDMLIFDPDRIGDTLGILTTREAGGNDESYLGEAIFTEQGVTEAHIKLTDKNAGSMSVFQQFIMII